MCAAGTPGDGYAASTRPVACAIRALETELLRDAARVHGHGIRESRARRTVRRPPGSCRHSARHLQPARVLLQRCVRRPDPASGARKHRGAEKKSRTGCGTWSTDSRVASVTCVVPRHSAQLAVSAVANACRHARKRWRWSFFPTHEGIRCGMGATGWDVPQPTAASGRGGEGWDGEPRRKSTWVTRLQTT
jgi:hypothetical protein